MRYGFNASIICNAGYICKCFFAFLRFLLDIHAFRPIFAQLRNRSPTMRGCPVAQQTHTGPLNRKFFARTGGAFRFRAICARHLPPLLPAYERVTLPVGRIQADVPPGSGRMPVASASAAAQLSAGRRDAPARASGTPCDGLHPPGASAPVPSPAPVFLPPIENMPRATRTHCI